MTKTDTAVCRCDNNDRIRCSKNPDVRKIMKDVNRREIHLLNEWMVLEGLRKQLLKSKTKVTLRKRLKALRKRSKNHLKLLQNPVMCYHIREECEHVTHDLVTTESSSPLETLASMSMIVSEQ